MPDLKISKLEDTTIETILSKERNPKNIHKSTHKLYDNFKESHIWYL